MSVESVSAIGLILSLKGKGQSTVELKRHLAPKTVGSIVRSLPVEGNAHTMGRSIVFMDTCISTGGEKLKTRFKRGDVSFMASNSSICFFLDDTPSTKAMTLVGRITSNIEMLKEIKVGDVFSLTQAGT